MKSPSIAGFDTEQDSKREQYQSALSILQIFLSVQIIFEGSDYNW